MSALADLLDLAGKERQWLLDVVESISNHWLASVAALGQSDWAKRRSAIERLLETAQGEDDAVQIVRAKLRKVINQPLSATAIAAIVSRENGYLTIPLLGWLGDNDPVVVETLADWASFMNPWTGHARDALLLIPNSSLGVIEHAKKALAAADDQAIGQLLSQIVRMVGVENGVYLGLVRQAARHSDAHIRDVAAFHLASMTPSERAQLADVDQALRQDPVAFVRDTARSGE